MDRFKELFEEEVMKNSFPDSKLGFKWWAANLAEILAMLETLYEKFPKTFFRDGKKVKPLKIGIRKDIKVVLELRKKYDSKSLYQKKLLWAGLSIYTRTPEYLEKLSKQLYRIDLKGKRTERVTDEQVLLAKARLREIKKGNRFLNTEIDLKNPDLVKLFEATASQDNMSVDEYLKKVLYFYSKTVNFDPISPLIVSEKYQI